MAEQERPGHPRTPPPVPVGTGFTTTLPPNPSNPFKPEPVGAQQQNGTAAAGLSVSGPQPITNDPSKPIGYPGTWEEAAAASGGISLHPKGKGGMWGGPPTAPPYASAPPYPYAPYPGGQAYPQQPGYGAPVYGQPQQQPPPQQQQGWSGSEQVPRPMPGAGGKRKAFICGINYTGSGSQLRGCINDAKCMEYLLKTKFGFQQENILMMTDEVPDPLRQPTRMNMWQGFRWLMMDLRPGDSLVFHYSGHGGQCTDYSGEESDGKNETLCPLDFKTAGELVDDDINRILVNPLPTGVKLHAIIDACHSGSTMDLPYSAVVSNGSYAQWTSQYYSPAVAARKGTAGGFCVQIGAALDSQVAADTSAMSGYVSTGAATYAFIQAVEGRGTDITYGDLLIQMYRTLHAATGGRQSQGSGGGLLEALLGMPMPSQFNGQEPLLSANYAFDLNFKLSL